MTKETFSTLPSIFQVDDLVTVPAAPTCPTGRARVTGVMFRKIVTKIDGSAVVDEPLVQYLCMTIGGRFDGQENLYRSESVVRDESMDSE